MPLFHMVAVGCGGGPDETNLSGYLIKPSEKSWEDGVVALEAGSGWGALNRIMKDKPDLFSWRSADAASPRCYTASEIYSFIQCFLVTHAHLDHINGLIISAGSLKGPRKRIFATRQILQYIESIFADRIWPNLASWNEHDECHKLLYTSLGVDAKYRPISPDISVRVMSISHGHNTTSSVYDSSAFFVRHNPSAHEFLFFGDVEPDSLAAKPQTINVWRAAAPKIVKRQLHAIFIECSWPSGRSDALLFGHLTPEHLTAELAVLASEVVKHRTMAQSLLRSGSRPHKKRRANSPPPAALRGALDGVRVYVIHCKDSMEHTFDQPINHVICDQVKTLVEERGLGAEILVVDQGMLIEI